MLLQTLTQLVIKSIVLKIHFENLGPALVVFGGALISF